ncbi:FUSC family protein [Curtobacterium sp. MCBD17_028]|nr:FUSC family protein [Curtobacterium sp. MCBD17_028]
MRVVACPVGRRPGRPRTPSEVRLPRVAGPAGAGSSESTLASGPSEARGCPEPRASSVHSRSDPHAGADWYTSRTTPVVLLRLARRPGVLPQHARWDDGQDMTTTERPPHSARTINIEGAARAAVAGGVPLAVLIGSGLSGYAAFALFAGFAAIPGAREPYGRRVVTVTTAGLLQAACMLAGVAMSMTGAPLWAEAVGLAVVLVVAVGTLSVLQAIPAQPIFPVFAFVVCSLVPVTPAQLPGVVGIVLGAVAFAWVVSMGGFLARAVWGESMRHLFRPFVEPRRRSFAVLRSPALWETVGLNLVGALVAGAVGEATGLGHPYWAVVAVVSTLPALRQRHTIQRAVQRVVGTIGGTVVAVGVLLLHPTDWWIVLIAVLGQFWAEIFVARNYAVCLLFLTPLALAVSWLSLPEAPERLAVERIVQTALGAAVSVLLLLAGGAVERRRGRPLGATSAIRTV